MEFLEYKLISGAKRWTNRAQSNYRDKCNIGDVMHIFVKMRTPESRKLFDAVVKNKIKWEIGSAPKSLEDAKEECGPIPVISWYEFAIGDGFLYYNQEQAECEEKRYCIRCNRFKITNPHGGRGKCKENKLTSVKIDHPTYSSCEKFELQPNFINYFQNHPKKTEKFICFVFKKLLTIEDFLPVLKKIQSDLLEIHQNGVELVRDFNNNKKKSEKSKC